MYFQHSPKIWAAHPSLVAGVAHVAGINAEMPVDGPFERFSAIAKDRLGQDGPASLPEIQAWRRAFSAMGLKPTQYRCASEALLRRFAKEATLPRIHPMVDLCNAISLAYAVPIAVLDVSRISGDLEVRPADGDEEYLTFSGETEHPAPGEVVFADTSGRAHARRWTNRQSGYSATREATTSVLIVAEALHESAPADVPRLIADVADEVKGAGAATVETAVLTADSPRFVYG